MMNKPLSTINSQITEDYLRNQRENQYFERKGMGEKDSQPAKIADELIGMLNADGGVLAFGVSDDGIIQNLDELGERLDKYRTLVYDFIHPASDIELEDIEIDGKRIFLYHVEHDIERVFSRKDNDRVFLRVWDTNREQDREQVKKLEYDKGIRKFEEEIVKDFDEDDLNYELLQEYKQKLNYQGDVFELLQARHLTKKIGENRMFKNASVLLFAKDPEKYIMSASVRYIRYSGVEELTGASHNVIKDVRFENNIPILIDKIKLFLRTSLRDYYFLDIEIGKFKKVPEYPEDAWLEGVVNALCHRSYNMQGSSIYIKHFEDRIEISNSGPLPAQVTVDNIKTERFARNPRIARVLEDLGYVRQLNEGVSRIYESMEKSMLSKPEYKEVNGNVYLTLSNNIRGHSKTIHQTIIEKIETNWHNYNDSQKMILNCLFIKHHATLADFVKYVGVNEKTLRLYINSFIKDGLMDKVSEKKRDINALYVLKRM